VELYGGYDSTFKERNPWKRPSELLWKKDSQNRTDTSRARVSGSHTDHSGAVLDGFVIDMKDLNSYTGGPDGNLTEPRLQQAVNLEHPGSVIRNCVIANSPLTGLRIRQGGTVENNVIVNSVDLAIDATGGNTLSGNKNTDPAVIRHNTIVGTWVSGSPSGKGGAGGIGIKIDKSTVVEGNIIAFTANHGIWLSNNSLSGMTLKNNVFHRNLFANVKFYLEGKDSAIDDSDMELLGELGFHAQEGNVVTNPELSFDSRWLDRYTLHAFRKGNVVSAEDWNSTRKTAGLPPLTASGDTFAPAYDVKKVSGLLAPHNSSVTAGARVLELDVKPFVTAPPTGPVKTYQKIDLATWAKKPESVDGTFLEMIVSLQGVTGTTGLSDVSPETHGARFLEGRVGGGDRIVGIYKKGTNAERVFEAAKSFGSFVGEAMELYVVRGTARASSGYPKAAFLIDSIAPYEALATSATRPVGRDWYVRADEKGGDGSKEKPFRDPYQALEKVGPGDVIHITEGEYGGKLKNGKWVVTQPYVSLLGGYDRDFTARDPWDRPSLFQWPADSKTKGQGYLLEGSGDHTGLILDGLVFDHRTLNVYREDGNLNADVSDKGELVWVFSPGVLIRNCVFVNGVEGALRMSPSQTIENNIFVNMTTKAISVQGSGTALAAPVIIRHNSFLMVWDRRYGDRATSTGNGLYLSSNGLKADIEDNLFQFIHNNAIYSNVEERTLTLVGNVFSFNGWSNYRHEPKMFDDGNMEQLAEVGFNKISRNVVVNPNIPYDEASFDAYYQHALGKEGGKHKPEQWATLRSEGGFPPPAADVKARFAPAVGYKQAGKLFPRNPEVKAGAHKKSLDSKIAN
jgi:hypothetical protein